MRDVDEKDLELFEKAKELAMYGGYANKVACLAVINRTVLAGTVTMFRKLMKGVPFNGATYHAEPNCIALVPNNQITKVTLYIARLDKDYLTKPSRPCITCIPQIVSVGIHEIVYTSKLGRVVKEYW